MTPRKIKAIRKWAAVCTIAAAVSAARAEAAPGRDRHCRHDAATVTPLSIASTKADGADETRAATCGRVTHLQLNVR